MKKPNILLITSDQQHWNTLGCRNPEIKTPHLDRLAAEGTLFSRAYCPNPTCTPTRSSIITGLYPSQHGAYSLGTKLSESVPTIGEQLSRSGYQTALVGKAHFQPLLNTGKWPSIESNPLQQDLEYWKHFTGPFYGFRHVELLRNHTDEYHAGQHYALWMESKGLKDWRKYFQQFNAPHTNDHYRPGDKSHRGSWTLPEEFHYNHFISERSKALLSSYAENDEPFFLWASFPDPHPPYVVPSPWSEMYDPTALTVPRLTPGEHEKNPPHHRLSQTSKPDFSVYQEPGGHFVHGGHSHLHDPKDLARDMALYYGMMSFTDEHVGRITQHLKTTGLEENTLVVFTTDHGHFYGHHGLIAKGPFHYEDMIKVPMLVKHKGKVPSGKESSSLQSLVDLAPTFLAWAGCEQETPMAGKSQKPVWTGEQSSLRDHILVENHHQPTTVHLRTRVDERYKITVYFNQPYGEIFDLQKDPGEVENLWDNPEHQELKKDLLLKLTHAELGKELMPMPRVWGA